LNYTILLLFLIAISIAVFLSPFASEQPDGLEKVAQDKKFDTLEKKSTLKSPFPDYSVSPVKNDRISTALAGLIGAVVSFGAVFIIGYILHIKKNSKSQ